jgi:glycosyltransferase involved in cell wall biosynthesis
MALGLPVAADLLSSYMPFKSYFADIRSEKLVNLIKYPSQYYDCVEEVQKYIQDKFTKKAISNEWIDLIDKQIKEASSVKTVTNETCTLQILILTYNQENLCHRIITNVESYVSSNINVLIQDDCSQDGTYRELSKYFDSHPYVKVFRNVNNLGTIRNCASLISRASSEYILCLAGDDFLVRDELLKAVNLIKINPVDIGVFNCAHAELGVIDKIIFGAPNTSEKLNILIRNSQFTEKGNHTNAEFFNQIATMPGALWGQGIIFRASLIKKIDKMENCGVDEWGIFHNLAVYSQTNLVRCNFSKLIISVLAIIQKSRGSEVEYQLNRQLYAVINEWHPVYRKTALINILEKKLKQFQNSALEADEILTILKNVFTKT